MKYSKSQQQTMNELKIENARKFNFPLLKDELQRIGVIQAPAKVVEQVNSLAQRVGKFICLTFEEFNQKFPSEILPESTMIKLSGSDRKTIWPIGYVYNPELEGAVQELYNKELREKHLNRFKNFLSGKKLGLEWTPQIEEFVTNVLPFKGLPYTLMVDGSEQRVRSLRNKSGAVLYASSEVAEKLNSDAYQPGCIGDDVFAVEHLLGSTPVLTLFIKSHDYRGEFAAKMAGKTQIPLNVAETISANLTHDCYYTVNPDSITSDFEAFIEDVARLRRLYVGDVVHDYYTNAPIEAFFAPVRKQIVVDADDEYPCAVLVGNRLNIYIPANMMNETLDANNPTENS